MQLRKMRGLRHDLGRTVLVNCVMRVPSPPENEDAPALKNGRPPLPPPPPVLDLDGISVKRTSFQRLFSCLVLSCVSFFVWSARWRKDRKDGERIELE